MMSALLDLALRSRHVRYRYGSAEGFDCSELVRASSQIAEPPLHTVPVYLVTIPDVELLEVGQDWHTSTGDFSWDEEDVLSCVASQSDPAVRTPVIKLGHCDPRFDGQPCFGRIENMHVKNNGQTLAGDLVGVPQWLANIAPTAYPRRSIEGAMLARTRTGNEWPMVLTGLALLGDAYPAVDTLEDLQLLWGNEAPVLMPVEDVEDVYATVKPDGSTEFRATRGRGEMVNWLRRRGGEEVAAAHGSRQVAATASMDDMITAFYDSLSSVQMWWWIRQILVNPLQLVVDDDDGGLWLIDVTPNADDTFTFSEGTAVKVEYVAAARENGMQRPGQISAARFTDPESAGGRARATVPSTEDGTGSTGTEEESPEMQLTPEALAALGLPPDATDEAINAAIVARGQSSSTTPGDDGNTQSQPETPATDPVGQPATAPAPEGAPGTTGEPSQPAEQQQVAASTPTVPEGMVLVDQAAWEQVRAGAEDGQRLARQAAEREREGILATACEVGKFPRSRVEHYRTAWAADPEGTRQMIAALPEGLIPVEARGAATETDPAVAGDNAYPPGWKPKTPAATGRARVLVGRD